MLLYYRITVFLMLQSKALHPGLKLRLIRIRAEASAVTDYNYKIGDRFCLMPILTGVLFIFCIAGLPVRPVKYQGHHSHSFYRWQGWLMWPILCNGRLNPCTKVQYLRPLENQQRIWYNFLRQKLYKSIETQTGKILLITKEMLLDEITHYHGTLDEYMSEIERKYCYIEVQLWFDDLIRRYL